MYGTSYVFDVVATNQDGNRLKEHSTDIAKGTVENSEQAVHDEFFIQSRTY